MLVPSSVPVFLPLHFLRHFFCVLAIFLIRKIGAEVRGSTRRRAAAALSRLPITARYGCMYNTYTSPLDNVFPPALELWDAPVFIHMFRLCYMYQFNMVSKLQVFLPTLHLQTCDYIKRQSIVDPVGLKFRISTPWLICRFSLFAFSAAQFRPSSVLRISGANVIKNMH